MRGRSLMLLVVAVGCGLATMYGVMQLQGSRPEEAQILVADRDLNLEETIKEDMVSLKKVPRASVPAGSFSSFRQVADRWPVIKILAGEPLVEPKLAAKGAPPGLP